MSSEGWTLRLSDTVPAVLLAASVCAVWAVIELSACVPDLPDPELPPDAASNPDASSSNPCGDGFIALPGEQCDPGMGGGDAGTGFCTANCKMVCPDGGFLWESNNHCYTLPGTAGSLDEAAKTTCTNGAHVVTFASDEEFEAVTGFFGAADDGGEFWVGIQTHASVVDYEPGWEPQCAGCYARTSEAGLPLPRYDADAFRPQVLTAENFAQRGARG